MELSTIMALEIGIIVILPFLAAIVVGIMFLAHYLKKNEMNEAVKMMKEQIVPETEAMADRMIKNVMESTTNSMIKMVQGIGEGFTN